MRVAPAISAPARWHERVLERARQHPLIDTRATLEGLRRAGRAPKPGAVYLGVGLCGRSELSKAVPLDLLGLVLPAEAVRRAAGARELVVLIADRHARESGFCASRVEERSAAVHAALARIGRQCGLPSLSVVRATEISDEKAYRDGLATVRRVLGPAPDDYTARQLADALYLEQRAGGLLKVGWVLRGADPARRRDEVAFDTALRRVVGDRVPFVYCKPGRSLAAGAPRVPPYIVTQPKSRLCLDGAEDPVAKLRAARRTSPRDAIEGYRRYLRALVYTFNRDIDRLPRGPLEDRAAALIRLLAPRAELAEPLVLERDAS